MSLTLVINTLLLGFGTALGSVVLGGLMVMALLLLPRGLGRLIPFGAAANLLIPQYLVIATWMEWFGREGAAFGGSGVIDRVGWLYTVWGAMLILALMFWPIPFFFLATRRAAMTRALAEVDPFISGPALWTRLLAPQCARPLFWSGLLVFALAVNQLAVPGILQVRVLAEEVFVRFNTRLDLWEVSQLAIPLVLPAMLLTLGLWGRDFGGDTVRRPVSPAWMRLRLGRWNAGAVFALSLFALGMGLCFPLGHLILSPVTWRDLIPAVKAGQSAIGYSVLFAGLSATVVTLLGVALGRFRGAVVFWWCFVIPGTVFGAYLATANNRLYAIGWDLGWMALVLAIGLRYLGFGISGWRLVSRQVDDRLVDTARLEGLGFLERVRHAVWPGVGSGLLLAWWAVYLLCLWEVEVLIFLVPPGVETLSLRVFNLLHYGHNSQVNAACLVLLGLGALPGLVYWGGRRWFGRGARLAGLVALLSVMGCRPNGDPDPLAGSQFFETVEVVGKKGTGVGQFNKPRSIAVGADDEVFAVDMTGRVQRFTASGEYVSFWQMPETERGRPKGMTCDSLGRIVVVEPHYARVNHFTPDGELLLQWGQRGEEEGQLAFPRSVVAHSGGDLFVTEFQRVERVQRFSLDGQSFGGSFGSYGFEPGTFNRAEGIGIDAEDRLYVADSCNHRVQIFEDDGRLVRQYGRPGTGPGELSYPYDVRVDASGFQFVCEFGNSRIQVFDPDGNSVEIIGGPGSALGEFSNPWSLAMDSEENLWVADSGNHRLQKLVRKRSKP